MSVDRMSNNRAINISVSISGPLEELARVATSVDCTIKKMKSRVYLRPSILVLTLAIQEARMRGTQEYLARHPNGINALVRKS